MDLKELIANKESAQKAWLDFLAQIGQKQHEIIESWLQKSGVKDAHLREHWTKQDRKIEYLEIYAPNEDPKDWHGKWSFSFYWREPWPHERTNWKAELNIGTSGSFDCRNADQVNMYIVAGFLAAHLKEIEDELLALDWDTYKELRYANSLATNKLESAERAVKQAEHDAKIQKILSGLKVGTKIRTQKKDHWRGELIQNITWMSAKNLTVGGSSRIKLQDAADRILNGTWEVVD